MTPCQKRGFNFPDLGETASSFSVYQDSPRISVEPNTMIGVAHSITE